MFACWGAFNQFQQTMAPINQVLQSSVVLVKFSGFRTGHCLAILRGWGKPVKRQVMSTEFNMGDGWLGIKIIMAYQQQSRLNQFVPGYVAHSDFLPTRIIEVSEEDRLQILRDIEQDRRMGRVLTQRPADFNPNRYVSYQVYENVHLNQSIAPEQIQSIVASRRLY